MEEEQEQEEQKEEEEQRRRRSRRRENKFLDYIPRRSQTDFWHINSITNKILEMFLLD